MQLKRHNIQYYLKFAFNSLYGFYAPHLCLICKNTINFNNKRSDYICNKCLDSLPLAKDSEHILNDINTALGKEKVSIDNAVSLFDVSSHGDFLEVIHALKYQSLKMIGYEFGKLLWKKMKMEGRQVYDFIVPVPLHSAKKRERGYNQSDLIGLGLSEISGIPFNKRLLKRKSYTKTQTLLNASERQINLLGVFSGSSKSNLIEGKRILIVDDVLTTGSTINNAAIELKKAGALTVDAATLAKA